MPQNLWIRLKKQELMFARVAEVEPGRFEKRGSQLDNDPTSF